MQGGDLRAMEEIETWLTQLETEMHEDAITTNHLGHCQKRSQHHHDHPRHDHHLISEIMERPGEAVLDEELVVAPGPSVYPDHLAGKETNPTTTATTTTNNSSSLYDHEQLDFDYPRFDFQPNFCYAHFDPLSHILPHDHTNIIHHEDTVNQKANNRLQLGERSTELVQHEHHQSAAVGVGDNYQKNNDKMCKNDDHHDKKQGGGGASTSSRSTKRKREPSEAQDHINAERKRRELLSTQFVSLSAIVPGLKKMDKTSVLGEAIKYMEELKKKVKALEEVAAKRTVEPVVVVKKSKLVVADEDNEASSSGADSCNNGGEGGGRSGESLPEIEVRVWDKSMLIKVCCEKRKGMLPKLFQEVEKLGINVINSSVMPFGTLALDITILAQIEKELNANVKDVIRNLGSALSP
uniref:BHLH domain-containing protein n=1 Tax=Opuntia streptacantha TaxID=393608 RepID=A0A7C9AIW8_OPUST